MKFNANEQKTIDLPVPPISNDNEKALENYSMMIREDYEQFKIDFLTWLLTKGMDTYRGEGFSESTVKTTHYKIEDVYRWMWEVEEEFSKEVPQHRATELIDTMMKNSPHPDSYVHTFEKCIRRLFKFFREAKNREIAEWEHEIPIEPSRGSDKKENIKDRFYPDEMNRLYEAAIQTYSIKNYYNLDSEEREELKRTISQQQGVKMDDVGPENFKNATSWKYPSIISMSADLGLRPIEVGNMKTNWLDLPRDQINIPAEESTKNSESWSCELSSKSSNALENWMQERQSYEKYNGTNTLWLTKYANPYTSRSLNRVLDKLMEEASLDEGNRTLSYYSFRHGADSIWTEKDGIAKAAEQLRHSNLETTRKYTRTNDQSGVNHANDKW